MKTPTPFSHRPALTAIAAVLALASTPALAQVAVPLPADPPADPVAQPQPTAPAATVPPPVTLPQVVPQASVPAPAPAALPALPEVAAAPAPRSAPEREAQAEPTAAAPARTSARAERAVPAAAPAPAPTERVSTEPNREAAPAETVAPVISPADLRAMEQRQQTSEAVPASAQATSDTTYWALGAGGAALLLGMGALAFLRRRDRAEEAREDAAIDAPLARPEPVPAPSAPALSAAAAPVGYSPAAITAVVATPDASGPTAPARRAPSMTTGDAYRDRLEAMVAEAPSAENPFRTRRQRLRRAEYILRTGHAPEDLAPAPASPASPAAPEPAHTRAPQPVYDFGGGRKPVSFRPGGWKPATT